MFAERQAAGPALHLVHCLFISWVHHQLLLSHLVKEVQNCVQAAWIQMKVARIINDANVTFTDIKLMMQKCNSFVCILHLWPERRGSCFTWAFMSWTITPLHLKDKYCTSKTSLLAFGSLPIVIIQSVESWSEHYPEHIETLTPDPSLVQKEEKQQKKNDG